VDESGLSERPHRVRTWAPRGQTPVLQYHFNGETLAVMAGMTFVNFYFQLYEGTIKAPQVLRFLAHLQRHLQGKLILLWDRLPAHRSRLVQDYLAGQRRIEQEWLPAYAPELNPVEYLRGQLKEHQVGNFCLANLGELSFAARRARRRLRQRRRIVACCWKQAIWPL
jgi:transposase